MSDVFPINDDNSTPFKMGRRNIGALQNNVVKDKDLTSKVLKLGLVARNMGKIDSTITFNLVLIMVCLQ